VRSADVARTLGETWPGGPSDGGFDFAANTNIIEQGGRTLAIIEAGASPYELTHELETVGPSNFCGTLFGGYTAHPKKDPATGELHAVSYNPMRGNVVQYTVTGVDGKVRRNVDIRLKAQTMMHDFSLTEKHVVIYDLPVALDLGSILRRKPAKTVANLLTRFVDRHATPDFFLRAAMRGSARGGGSSPSGMPYRWAPERQARVGVMPREGAAADIRWFEVNACYVFHPLNAYDDDGKVVLDVVRHESVFASGHALVPGNPTLDRWTVDLTTGKVVEERIDDTGQEFPRVDERLVGRRHRYGYSVGMSEGGPGISAPGAILKQDLTTRRTQPHVFGPGREPGEFVFVPSSADAAEDDGVVMGFVYDQSTDRSDLVLLDGQTMETVATVHLPARVPHGFHGNWVPTEG
jgi:carotenoid cleavage dioxygenase